jgi:hypothetical protein
MPYYTIFEKNPKTARGCRYKCGCITSSGRNNTPIEVFSITCPNHNQPPEVYFTKLSRNPYPEHHNL